MRMYVFNMVMSGRAIRTTASTDGFIALAHVTYASLKKVFTGKGTGLQVRRADGYIQSGSERMYVNNIRPATFTSHVQSECLCLRRLSC